MAFTPRPLQIPNMRTDYSAENSAFSGLGQTLGNLPGEFRKEQQNAQKQQILGQIGSGALDYDKGGRALIALGDTTAGAALLGLGQKQNEQAQRTKILGQWGTDGGAAAPTAAAPSGGYFATTANAESSNNPAAKNPNSSATGLYQFTDGTWADVAKANPQLGLTPDGRTDPAQQQKAMQAFTGQNAKILQSQGIPPNDANLYMTHFLGAQGGPTFIKGVQASPNAPAVSFVSPQAAAANKGVFFNQDGTPRTAGEVYQRMTARFGSGSTAIAGQGESASQPVQVAQAPAQAGTPVADAPAQGAVETQFVIPGTNTPVASVPSIANDPKVKTWQQRYTQAAGVGDEKLMNVAKAQLEFATKDAERRYNEGKAPEAVREWQWAKQKGLTQTNSPVEYAKELAAAKRDPDTDVTNLRKEVQQLPSYKNISQAAPIYRSMFETAGRNTKASDLNLVYGLGKIMDPTSVVREGEMIMVKNSAGMSEQLMGAINALNGGAGLTPETRQALMAEAYSRMNTYKGQFDQDMKQYRGIVGRRGFNADDVIPDPGEFSPYEGAPKTSGKGQPAPAAPAPIRPVESQYVRPDGSSPPTPAAPATPSGPRRGELVDGYRFKGGDAGKPESWVKVK